MPDNVGFYPDMTGRENLRFTAALNGLEKQVAEKSIDRLLERTGLTEAGNQKVGTYSRGMRQRLGVADVLIKDPSVIIMDEPTLGIDPEGDVYKRQSLPFEKSPAHCCLPPELLRRPLDSPENPM